MQPGSLYKIVYKQRSWVKKDDVRPKKTMGTPRANGDGGYLVGLRFAERDSTANGLLLAFGVRACVGDGQEQRVLRPWGTGISHRIGGRRVGH